MFLFIGGAMGYVSTISTKIEQILCARGYTDQLSGLSGALILLCGFFASFGFGVLAYKTKRLILILRSAGVVSILAMVLMAYFFRQPNSSAAIIASCALLGTAALGVYPLALELVVECTYPVDQAIGTAFLFLSSAIQGVLLMQVEHYLGSPLSEAEMEVQSCVEPGEDGHQQPKNYGSYLNFITVYMIVLILIFMAFFRTDMKRTRADEAAVKVRADAVAEAERATVSSIVRDSESSPSVLVVADGEGFREEDEPLVDKEGSPESGSTGSSSLENGSIKSQQRGP